jgi:hypothetical protein
LQVFTEKYQGKHESPGSNTGKLIATVELNRLVHNTIHQERTHLIYWVYYQGEYKNMINISTAHIEEELTENIK